MWRRRIALGVFTLAIVGLLVWAFLPRPVAVDLREITRGPLEVRIAEEGTTRVIDRYVVSAPVAGYMRRVEWRAGDAIEQGAVIAELEPLRSEALDPRTRAQAEMRVAATESALRAAEEQEHATAAEADFAKKEYERKMKLCAEGCVSREEQDRAESAWRRAEASLRRARFLVEVSRHELASARTVLEHAGAGDRTAVSVSAPVGGRILRVIRESEGVVQPGEPLVEVGNPRALEVEVEVLSEDAVQMHPGMTVEFVRWGGNPLKGLVRRVEPTGFTKVSALGVEEQRVHVIADITSPPEQWSQLGDGFRVEASFIVWSADDVLRIPTSALFRHGDGWAAYVVEDGRATQRTVVVGHRGDLLAEVLDGVSAGEHIIAHPSDSVSAGTRITAR